MQAAPGTLPSNARGMVEMALKKQDRGKKDGTVRCDHAPKERRDGKKGRCVGEKKGRRRQAPLCGVFFCPLFLLSFLGF
ncbi:hypothetical protein [Pandoravirus japonicus]|uniref:Uncharacterized protein n=1 Tax=Pandoravirus japonicus TaxID=2823154 RepID=A0A811BMQ7_9VIRU|nr:hypothetical protein [Pandoravirus japonicus]